MADRSWNSKGDKVPRQSPGNRCGRPFKAPRPVTTDKEEIEFQLGVTEIDDSGVQVLTDNAVQKIQNQINRTDSIADSEVQIVMGTENERDIIARQDKDEHTLFVSADSDTTASTPDILKSPVMPGIKMLSARGGRNSAE
jgi:hypothetical protein